MSVKPLALKKEDPKLPKQLFDFKIRGMIEASSPEVAGDILFATIYEKTRGFLEIRVIPNR